MSGYKLVVFHYERTIVNPTTHKTKFPQHLIPILMYLQERDDILIGLYTTYTEETRDKNMQLWLSEMNKIGIDIPTEQISVWQKEYLNTYLSNLVGDVKPDNSVLNERNIQLADFIETLNASLAQPLSSDEILFVTKDVSLANALKTVPLNGTQCSIDKHIFSHEQELVELYDRIGMKKTVDDFVHMPSNIVHESPRSFMAMAIYLLMNELSQLQYIDIGTYLIALNQADTKTLKSILNMRDEENVSIAQKCPSRLFVTYIKQFLDANLRCHKEFLLVENARRLLSSIDITNLDFQTVAYQKQYRQDLEAARARFTHQKQFDVYHAIIKNHVLSLPELYEADLAALFVDDYTLANEFELRALEMFIELAQLQDEVLMQNTPSDLVKSTNAYQTDPKIQSKLINLGNNLFQSNRDAMLDYSDQTCEFVTAYRKLREHSISRKPDEVAASWIHAAVLTLRDNQINLANSILPKKKHTEFDTPRYKSFRLWDVTPIGLQYYYDALGIAETVSDVILMTRAPTMSNRKSFFTSLKQDGDGLPPVKHVILLKPIHEDSFLDNELTISNFKVSVSEPLLENKVETRTMTIEPFKEATIRLKYSIFEYDTDGAISNPGALAKVILRSMNDKESLMLQCDDGTYACHVVAMSILLASHPDFLRSDLDDSFAIISKTHAFLEHTRQKMPITPAQLYSAITLAMVLFEKRSKRYRHLQYYKAKKALFDKIKKPCKEYANSPVPSRKRILQPLHKRHDQRASLEDYYLLCKVLAAAKYRKAFLLLSELSQIKIERHPEYGYLSIYFCTLSLLTNISINQSNLEEYKKEIAPILEKIKQSDNSQPFELASMPENEFVFTYIKRYEAIIMHRLIARCIELVNSVTNNHYSIQMPLNKATDYPAFQQRLQAIIDNEPDLPVFIRQVITFVLGNALSEGFDLSQSLLNRLERLPTNSSFTYTREQRKLIHSIQIDAEQTNTLALTYLHLIENINISLPNKVAKTSVYFLLAYYAFTDLQKRTEVFSHLEDLSNMTRKLGYSEEILNTVSYVKRTALSHLNVIEEKNSSAKPTYAAQLAKSPIYKTLSSPAPSSLLDDGAGADKLFTSFGSKVVI